MYHETIPLFSCGIVEDHGQLFQSSRIYRVDYRENEYSLIGSLKNVKAALIERLIYYFEITYSKIATFFVFGSQHASFEVHKGGGRGGGLLGICRTSLKQFYYVSISNPYSKGLHF